MFMYLSQAKLAAQVVAGLGVSKIVTDIIKNNVAITTPVQAVTVKVGTFVLGSMIWEQSANHIERQVDEAVSWFEKKKTENETEK